MSEEVQRLERKKKISVTFYFDTSKTFYLTNIEDGETEQWADQIRAGKPFDIKYKNGCVTINPKHLTHMDMNIIYPT